MASSDPAEIAPMSSPPTAAAPRNGMTPTGYGDDHREQTGDDHLAQGALSADVHAPRVLGLGVLSTLSQAGYLVELPAHLLDHVLGGVFRRPPW